MTETMNLKLKKPDTTDFYDVQDFNDNADVLDGAITELKEAQSEAGKAIEGKADSSVLTNHTDNKNNPHEVTKTQIGLGNVENKSSADIRKEITKENVTSALGYTPLQTANGGNAAYVNGHTVESNVPANAKFTDTTYTDATAAKAGLMGVGAQTFAGQKTFNAPVIPAGASNIATAQARKIYAGTTDLEAGVSALETGALYLVYE